MFEKYDLIEKYKKGTITDEEVGRLIEIFENEKKKCLETGNTLCAFIIDMVITLLILFRCKGDVA